MTENNEPPKSNVPPMAAEKAAEWVVRLHSDQAILADRMEFESWSAEGYDNRTEFAAHTALWEAVGSLRDNAEARALLTRPAATPRGLTRRRIAGIGVVAAAAAAAMALWIAPEPDVIPTILQTARGERHAYPLEDGSVVTLNTDSRVRVAFTKSERTIFLDQGQFFIKVAKDAKRPLRVFVQGHEVRALGTAFDVLKEDETRAAHVTLHEGIVGIYGTEERSRFGREKAPDVVLHPGQEAILAASSPISIRNVNLRVAETWLEGRVIFDDTPLSEAVKHINRYGKRRIVIADSAVSGLRISGMFDTDSTEDFVEALTEALPVRIEREDEAAIILGIR